MGQRQRLNIVKIPSTRSSWPKSRAREILTVRLSTLAGEYLFL